MNGMGVIEGRVVEYKYTYTYVHILKYLQALDIIIKFLLKEKYVFEFHTLITLTPNSCGSLFISLH